MLEPQEKTIDGITFRYQPMMATPARKLLDELVQRFGPVIGSFIEGLSAADELNLETEMNAMLGTVTGPLGSGIKQLSKQMDPKFHATVVEQLSKQTQFSDDDGASYLPLKKERVEVMFATRLTTELKWIAFCLEVQYADFFEPLRDLPMRAIALRAMANTASGSRSPKTSTGSSTESQPATATE